MVALLVFKTATLELLCYWTQKVYLAIRLSKIWLGLYTQLYAHYNFICA